MIACGGRPAVNVAAPVAAPAVAVAPQLTFLRSEDGMIVAFIGADSDRKIYAGDEAAVYEQRTIGYSSDGTVGSWSATMWAPRAYGGMSHVSYDGKTYALQCKKDGTVPLATLPEADQTRLRAATTTNPPLWTRQAILLARDERGTYYVVDALRESGGKTGHRVFIGKAGEMKEQAMTNVIDDEMGSVYSTKTGDLRLVTGGAQVRWEKGKKKEDLIRLSLDEIDNVYTIYRKLGIYGQLGSLCDNE